MVLYLAHKNTNNCEVNASLVIIDQLKNSCGNNTVHKKCLCQKYIYRRYFEERYPDLLF